MLSIIVCVYSLFVCDITYLIYDIKFGICVYTKRSQAIFICASVGPCNAQGMIFFFFFFFFFFHIKKGSDDCLKH
jgi:hypothetical protein